MYYLRPGRVIDKCDKLGSDNLKCTSAKIGTTLTRWKTTLKREWAFIVSTNRERNSHNLSRAYRGHLEGAQWTGLNTLNILKGQNLTTSITAFVITVRRNTSATLQKKKREQEGVQQYISNKYSCTKLGCSAHLEPSIKLEKLQLLLNHAFHHSCRLRTDKMSTQGASVFPSYNSLLNWQSGRIFCGGCCVVKYREIPTPNPPEILVTNKPSLARYSSC